MKRLILLSLIFIQCVCCYAQRIFNPKEATISNGLNSYTTQSFNCPSMQVVDKDELVTIIWGGDALTLKRSNLGSDAYMASKSLSGKNISITAYRSAQTRSIYLVTVVQKQGSETVRINFR